AVEQLLGEQPRLDPLGELNLFLRREQRDPADLGQVGPQQIAFGDVLLLRATPRRPCHPQAPRSAAALLYPANVRPEAKIPQRTTPAGGFWMSYSRRRPPRNTW